MRQVAAEQRRSDWIDVYKALGMALIVIGHFLPAGWLRNALYTFHVPSFFISSGFTFKTEDKFLLFLEKRAKTLLAPYLTFASLSLYVYIIDESDASIQSVAERVLFYEGNTAWNSPLWFLPVLFLIQMLSKLLLTAIGKLKNEKIHTGALFSLIGLDVLAGAYLVTTYHESPIPAIHLFGLDKAIWLMVYFLIGYALRYTQILNRLPQSLWLWVTVFITGTFLWSFFSSEPQLSLYHVWIDSYWKFAAVSITNSISIVMICRYIKLQKWMMSVSKHTIVIMSTHYFIMRVWNKVANNNNWKGLWVNLLAGAVTMLIYVLLVMLWDFHKEKAQTEG